MKRFVINDTFIQMKRSNKPIQTIIKSDRTMKDEIVVMSVIFRF